MLYHNHDIHYNATPIDIKEMVWLCGLLLKQKSFTVKEINKSWCLKVKLQHFKKNNIHLAFSVSDTWAMQISSNQLMESNKDNLSNHLTDQADTTGILLVISSTIYKYGK